MEKKKSDYAVMMESQKFYVLSNTNLFYLLNVYEFAVFNQIIHINDIDMNYASLNFLSELMNLSKNTVKKAVERLVALQMIERKRSLNGTYCYTLNVPKIEEIYNNVNSFRKIEDRKRYCDEYLASCGVPRNDTRVSRDGTRVPSDGSRVSRDGTHIKKISYKKDNLNNKDKSYNKDVEVGETANAETLNETANANSSFNNNSNVDKESVSTDDVISKMFPELPIEDNSNKTSVSIKNKSNSSIEEGTLNREPKNSTDVDSNNVNNGTADAGISSNNDKIEEQANADSNDVNKALVSIENKKTTDCSNEGKSFNREPENDVIVDSNDVVTIDETALAKDYYQRVLYTESLEELESLSNEIKQLPIKESYIKELLQLIETTSEQFNENSEDASEFDLNESLNNNPIFARVYNTVLASLSKFNLGTLVAYKEQLQSDDLKELSQQEKIELQNLVENSIIKLQERYSNIA